MTTSNSRLFSDLPIPPGENLAEEIEARGMSLEDIASILGMSEQLVADIIRGEQPITGEIASGLEKAIGVRAGFWTGLEANYRETLERIRERQALAGD